MLDSEKGIELVDLENEEERDRESVELVLKKYAKPLKYMFSKYCFSTGVHSKNALFNDVEQEY